MSQFSVCILQRSIWRPITSQRHANAVPIFPSFLENAPLLSFLASHIPRFIACPKKKKEREKMATSRGVDYRLGGRNHDVSVKHLVTQPGNAPEARPSYLTTANVLTRSLWGTCLRRLQRPGPSKDADPDTAVPFGQATRKSKNATRERLEAVIEEDIRRDRHQQ